MFGGFGMLLRWKASGSRSVGAYGGKVALDIPIYRFTFFCHFLKGLPCVHHIKCLVFLLGGLKLWPCVPSPSAFVRKVKDSGPLNEKQQCSLIKPIERGLHLQFPLVKGDSW